MARPAPSQAITLLLVGMSFAVPAVVFTSLLAQSFGDPSAWWIIVPFTAGLGTFLTSVVVWPVLNRRAESVWNCTIAGGVIGVVAHPIAAAISFPTIFLFHWWTDGSAGPPAHTWMENAAAAVGAFLFLVFWWSFIAAMSFGWITMVIAAAVGFMVGLCRHIARRAFAHGPQEEVEASLAASDLTQRREQYLKSHVMPWWSSLAASCAALTIITVVSIGMLLVFGDFSPPTGPDVIFEKPAG